jgi:predicted secreted Zn-dependent protease
MTASGHALLLLALVSCGPPYVRWSHVATMELATVPEGVVIDDRVQLYEVNGETVSQIRRDLNRQQPTDAKGDRVAGYTRWSIAWKTRYEPGCKSAEVVVALTVGTTLPKWTPPPFIDPLVIGSWNRFEKGLAAHEQGHRNTGVHAAIEVYESIKRSFDEGRCDYPDSEAKAIIKKYDQINAEYDRHTDHGGNEGVELR